MKKVIAVIGLIFVTSCGEGYSHGDRVGVITKFSNKGLICKTWEGQLNLGGFKTSSDEHGNSQVVANVWEFTVKDEALVSVIQEAMDNGKRVKMHYNQWFITGPCQADTEYFIEKVQVLE